MGSADPVAPQRVVPAALSSPTLARRLVELSADVRSLDVEFLLHLAEFDARRDFAGMGYPSLWAYCTEVLHLRDGAAWRRIEAMKLLRRFPSLEAPLRDGWLSLTTVCLLGAVLTEENVDALAARAAFLSKNDTIRLVASLRPAATPPGSAPVQMQRGLGLGPAPATADAGPVEARAETEPYVEAASAMAMPAGAGAVAPVRTASTNSSTDAAAAGISGSEAARPATRAELRPAGAASWTLRVTLDDDARGELLRLAALTAHSTRGDLAAVLRDAVRCALEKHGKRRGAVRPTRARNATAPGRPSSGSEASPAPREAAAPPDPRAVPAAVKQAVWERDGGRCAWMSKDGKRCGSTWKLELAHVRPVAHGGQATGEHLRLECALHNEYEAVRVFGPRHVARFRPSLRTAGDRATLP